MTEKSEKVIVVVGPTASGKSDLAVELAREFDGEVISADSRQVYRGLDIGTGKVTSDEMKGIPHHLLDVADPRDRYTAAHFVYDGRAAIEGILTRNKVPIIAGGTGFYIDALIGNISIPSVPPNETLRTWLEEKDEETLFKMLEAKDKRRAQTVQKDNKRRLIRALEIAEQLDEVPISTQEQHYDVLWVGIELPDDELRMRIGRRLDARLKAPGMIEEAKQLHEGELSYERMEELGLEYRYLSFYLQNKLSLEEMREQLGHKIWQYARRQKTYWRRNEKVEWFSPAENGKISGIVRKFLEE